MDHGEDKNRFRHPWENEDPALGRQAPGRPEASEALLIPLARAQDAVARLEASVAAAPDDLAAGLRARVALLEAAGFLAHQGPAVHPHDRALRDAGLTGSYTLAELTRPAPGSGAVEHGSRRGRGGRRPFGRQRAGLRPTLAALAELTTFQPLKSVESLAAPLTQLGAPLAEDETTRVWLNALPGSGECPGLLAAAAVMAGLPGMARDARLALGPAYVAAGL